MKHEELLMGLKKLYLPTMAEGYVEVSKLSEKSKQTYEQYLATLVELELNGKHRQKVERLTVAAKIPLRKSTESCWLTHYGMTELIVSEVIAMTPSQVESA